MAIFKPEFKAASELEDEVVAINHNGVVITAVPTKLHTISLHDKKALLQGVYWSLTPKIQKALQLVLGPGSEEWFATTCAPGKRPIDGHLRVQYPGGPLRYVMSEKTEDNAATIHSPPKGVSFPYKSFQVVQSNGIPFLARAWKSRNPNEKGWYDVTLAVSMRDVIWINADLFLHGPPYSWPQYLHEISPEERNRLIYNKDVHDLKPLLARHGQKSPTYGELMEFNTAGSKELVCITGLGPASQNTRPPTQRDFEKAKQLEKKRLENGGLRPSNGGSQRLKSLAQFREDWQRKQEMLMPEEPESVPEPEPLPTLLQFQQAKEEHQKRLDAGHTFKQSAVTVTINKWNSLQDYHAWWKRKLRLHAKYEKLRALSSGEMLQELPASGEMQPGSVLGKRVEPESLLSDMVSEAVAMCGPDRATPVRPSMGVELHLSVLDGLDGKYRPEAVFGYVQSIHAQNLHLLLLWSFEQGGIDGILQSGPGELHQTNLHAHVPKESVKRTLGLLPGALCHQQCGRERGNMIIVGHLELCVDPNPTVTGVQPNGLQTLVNWYEDAYVLQTRGIRRPKAVHFRTKPLQAKQLYEVYCSSSKLLAGGAKVSSAYSDELLAGFT